MRFLKKGNSNSISLAYTSLVCPILEWGVAYWNPYMDGKKTALDRVWKKAAKFANHTRDPAWETLAQCRNIARIFALFKAYSGKQAWKALGDRLEGPYYVSRDDHDKKIRGRKQRTDIGKYSLVNTTIKMWNQLHADALETFPSRSHIFI
jgi:hypothetical protein